MSKSICAALLVGMIAAVSAHGKELRDLKVLYVGSERTVDYFDLLRGKVALIEARSRGAFRVRDAAAFDVVLLDWPQGESRPPVARGLVYARERVPDLSGRRIPRGRSHNVVDRARRLLARYVPVGPDTSDCDAWVSWWNENQRFAFASDAGDYRWYIDPLAKKRGVPITEIRGPQRASEPFACVTAR